VLGAASDIEDHASEIAEVSKGCGVRAVSNGEVLAGSGFID
jgi:hypothetical protein